MRFNSLNDWLDWQETLHPSAIDLGLDRVRKVWQRLSQQAPSFSIITVAGTNGKGSSVSMLASILQQAGYRVASYTSPHLQRYNERIRIQGREVDDERLCQAFERIDQARDGISLTYFEFGTLAALDIFCHAKIDIAVLEVGLGGRLDAVNIMDADVALITALDVDHSAWLGQDREAIALEKVGITRAGRPVVFSDPDVPGKALAHVRELGCEVYRLGHEYDYQYDAGAPDSWRWRGPGQRRDALPLPALRGKYQLDNAAGVLMVLSVLAERFPVDQQAIRAGLLQVSLAGRFQVLAGQVQQVLDVAHNPQAAQALANSLKSHPVPGKTLAVVAMLQDKDIKAVMAHMGEVVSAWYLAELPVPRTEKVDKLAAILRNLYSGCAQAPIIKTSDTVTQAWRMALGQAGDNDRIVVFGSFYTVAEVLQQAV